MSSSPWWYRQRALCIAALYFGGFFGAYTLAHAAHAQAIPAYAFFGDRYQTAIVALAAVLAAIGWCWRASGTSYLQVAVVWNYDALTDKLYIAGPFRYTRNPLYLGNLFQAAGIAMFAPPIGWWLIVLLQWLFLTALMHVEERGMLARYGAQFEAYRAAVPQLLPRAFPVAGEPAPHASFTRALLWETMSFGFVLALVVFAIFGRAAWQATWLIASAGAVLQYAIRWKDSRRAA